MGKWQRWVQHFGANLRRGWQSRSRRWRQFGLLVLVGICLTGTIAACAPGSANQSVELTLVSFAVTRDAYKAIIPKFAAQWKQEHGQTVTIAQSYGGSGAQARGVIDGLPADVVHLALGLDVDRIAKAGLIQPNWQQEFPNDSIVSRSVAALVTRAGNPKHINTWDDLTKAGVRVVTADPKTSGVARWNFLAFWNAAIQMGKDQAGATAFVGRIYQNAPVLTRDAREATDAFFQQGQGDALINYENEILLAQTRGESLAYTIPKVNIAIDNPIAIVDQNVVAHGNRAVVEAFVQYLFTPAAQAEFAKAGFRPIDPAIAKTKELAARFPPVEQLGTVADYGGWSAVQQKFFEDGALFDQIRSQLR
jgi:sulfate transport system substrate-binding protein